jgi:hypothetical protein
MQVALNGIIPQSVVNKQGVDFLMYMSDMRTYFDEGESIDAASEQAVVKNIKAYAADPTLRVYTDKQQMIVKEALKSISFFDEGKAKTVKTPSSFVKNNIIQQESYPVAWGRSTVDVLATKEQILAYLWCIESRCRRTPEDYERVVLEKSSPHAEVQYMSKHGYRRRGFSLRPRDGLSDCVWTHMPNGDLCVPPPQQPELRPFTDSILRSQAFCDVAHHPQRASNRGRAAHLPVAVQAQGGVRKPEDLEERVEGDVGQGQQEAPEDDSEREDQAQRAEREGQDAARRPNKGDLAWDLSGSVSGGANMQQLRCAAFLTFSLCARQVRQQLGHGRHRA